MLCQDIIKRFNEGDPEAFQKIYDVFYKDIFAYCYRYSLTREDAEELTHDIFLKLWNTRTFVDPEQGVKGYLITLSKHIVFTWLRNSVRKKKMRNDLIFHFTLKHEDYLPEKRIEASSALLAFHKLLNKLPPKRKMVYKMIRFNDMSYNEVADQLAISRDAVKDHMIKANRYIDTMKGKKEFLDYVGLLYLLIFPAIL